jgi:hypothetical protein
MSEEDPTKDVTIVRVPLTPLWRSAFSLGLLGLVAGLVLAGFFVVQDHAKADAVSKVFQAARTTILQFHAEKELWPTDFDFTRVPAELTPFNAAALSQSLAQCPLSGTWRFVQKGSAGKPAIIFTPESPGRSFQRTLLVVDRWIDDGHAARGQFLVGEESAMLKLTDE